MMAALRGSRDGAPVDPRARVLYLLVVGVGIFFLRHPWQIGVLLSAHALLWFVVGLPAARLVRHALNMVFGFSTAPLRLVSYMGALVGMLGAGLLLFILIRFAVAGSTVPGFAFVASMVALFSGVQLMALGIIGEYMARLYAGAIKRPAYVVQETTAGREGQA